MFSFSQTQVHVSSFSGEGLPASPALLTSLRSYGEAGRRGEGDHGRSHTGTTEYAEYTEDLSFEFWVERAEGRGSRVRFWLFDADVTLQKSFWFDLV
jgi:hypothetical protein